MSSQIISDQSHPNQTSYCSTMSEKLCLKWNDFQENDNTAFGVLREDLELTDVKIALPDFSVDLMKELDEKVKSLMEFSENLAPSGPQLVRKLKSAKFAEKKELESPSETTLRQTTRMV